MAWSGSLVLGMLLWGTAAVAQTDAAVPVAPGSRGAAYQEAMRWQGLQTRVTYYDPARPAPPLDGRARVPDPPPEPRGGGPADVGLRWAVIALAAVVLAVLGRMIWLYANVNVASLRRTEDAATGPARAAGPVAEARTEPPDLRRILGIADRQAALHALLAGALARAAAANDLRLHPSWTARDALRAIPGSWPQRAALGALALAAERAWFGGQPVSEDAFAAHVTAIRPLFAEGRR